jgi:hypothetical protein
MIQCELWTDNVMDVLDYGGKFWIKDFNEQSSI